MDTKETTTYHAVLIAAVVIGLIILYFIISVIRQQRKHRLLYKAKIRAEITTLEKERARIAADLHDELGPTLSAAKFKLSSITIISEDDERSLKDSANYIDSILLQVRQIANGLMPNTLIRKGTVPAIEEFIDLMKENSSLDISFHHFDFPELSQDMAIHVYRIIQEIINNTMKHADATKLKIKMNWHKGMLVIATADNGKGFNNDAVHDGNNGLGLANIRSRTEVLSGDVHIRSLPGKGTSLRIEIPLPH